MEISRWGFKIAGAAGSTPGQRAETALGKTFWRDVEGAVESRSVVFPGDSGAEFHQLALREPPAQGLVQRIRNVGWRASELHSEPQNQFFIVSKVRTDVEAGKTAQLFLVDSGFSAHGRVEVNSEFAPYHCRDFELSQFFQVGGNTARRNRVAAHPFAQFEQFGIVRAQASRHGNVTIPALHSPKN